METVHAGLTAFILLHCRLGNVPLDVIKCPLTSLDKKIILRESMLGSSFTFGTAFLPASPINSFGNKL